jgi:hypothetical protein
MGLIYTIGVPEGQVKLMGYDQQFNIAQMLMTRIFGESESQLVTDTYQFDNYSKYESTLFDVAKKAKRRKEQFPKDCQTAGAHFAQSGA